MSDADDLPTIANRAGPEPVLVEGSRNERYRRVRSLGRGAMGEVWLSDDRQIGREVALKVTRAHLREASGARFLAEARIQARLEHTSIVPVYDVGLDEAGDPYFTMKRVNGLTLRKIVDSLRAEEPAAVAEYTRRRLLTAFGTMCLTVDYAHKHEVFHRDLKPSNVMLGEYGELYVLDWGVARSARVREEAPTLLELEAVGPETLEGAVVGTLGYMAPEQARGEKIDARADVYSLGAILFEILTLVPLHPRGDAKAAMVSALRGEVDARPSVRAPDREVPPELEAICVKATAHDPAERYPTARALHEAVDRFLEGDRDVERRRILAHEHARTAHELAARALATDDPAGRALAMAEVSRALAFDPSHVGARRVMFRLLTEPPKTLPAAVTAELEKRYEAEQRRTARGGALLYTVFSVFLPITLLVYPVRAAWYFVVLFLLLVTTTAVMWRGTRLTLEQMKNDYSRIVMSSLTLSWVSGCLGHLVLVPTLVIANLIGFLMAPDRRRRRTVIALSFGVLIVPQLAESLGIVPPAYVNVDGTCKIMNRVIDLTVSGPGVLLALTLAFMGAIAVFFTRSRDALSEAEQRVVLHAWQLRQLVPDDQSAVLRPSGS